MSANYIPGPPMSPMIASLLCFFVTDGEEGGLSSALGICVLMTEDIISIHLAVRLHFPVDPPKLTGCRYTILCLLPVHCYTDLSSSC